MVLKYGYQNKFAVQQCVCFFLNGLNNKVSLAGGQITYEGVMNTNSISKYLQKLQHDTTTSEISVSDKVACTTAKISAICCLYL